MVNLIALLLAIAVAIPLGVWQAFVFQTLWGWFATPVFGMPAPSLWMVFGLVLMVGLLKSQPEDSGAEGSDVFAKLAGSAVYSLMTSFLALLFGAFALWMAGA